MDISHITTLEQWESSYATLKALGFPIPQEFMELGERFKAENEQRNKLISEFPIYGTLKANAKFPYTEEFEKCVKDTVDKLLETGEDATRPGLLLGKIQCGKTNTFENVMALAMDRGIDICIAFTKGTNALSTQTIERFKKDFSFFKQSNDLTQPYFVQIEEILNLRLTEGEVINPKNKFVVVCKKEDDNLNALIKLYENLPLLKARKTLIIDDEADFASINYTKYHGEMQMGVIPQQIYDFRNIPNYCRYLQVTATPQALFLQPNGEFKLSDGKLISSFKPRFTTVVPEHKNYIGGRHYYEYSENEESMYSHIYQPVSDKILSIFGKEDQRYINNNIKSKNLEDLTKFVISYFVATSIRVLQEEKINKHYQSSAIVHCEISMKMHKWQNQLITKIIDVIRNMVGNGEFYSYEKTKNFFDTIFEDFKESNRKAHNENLVNKDLYFPTIKEVETQFNTILKNKDYMINVVNSVNNVKDMLDDNGQLKLKTTANIFIGGSILDRGITVANLIHFYYGRMPKIMQMDTVLQHARMYGSRSKEDMAVTRFYTTEFIYSNLVEINDFDNMLRQWIEKGLKDEDAVTFLEYSKTIRPCSQQKIMPSNTIFVKPNRPIVPRYFDTKKDIEEYVKQIDDIMSQYPEHEFFEIDKDTCCKILNYIDKTFDIDDSMKNQSFEKNSMINCLEYLTKNSNGKLICKYYTGRKLKRLRVNGEFNAAPLSTNTEIKACREIAQDVPVFVLVGEQGKKEDGWSGNSPFWWPIIVPQLNINSFVFTQSARKKSKEWVDPHVEDLIKGINPDEILNLTLSTKIFGQKGFENFDMDMFSCENREIRETTAARYLERDFNHPTGYKIDPNLDSDEINSLYFIGTLQEDLNCSSNERLLEELLAKQKRGYYLTKEEKFFIWVYQPDYMGNSFKPLELEFDYKKFLLEAQSEPSLDVEFLLCNMSESQKQSVLEVGYKQNDSDECQNSIMYESDIVFPFVPREYKYILFNSSRDNDGDRLLVKLKEGEEMCEYFVTPERDQDIITEMDGQEIDLVMPTRYFIIRYNFEKYIGKLLNPTKPEERKIIFY